MKGLLATVLGILSELNFHAANNIKARHFTSMSKSDLEEASFIKIKTISSVRSIFHCAHHCLQNQHCEGAKYVAREALCLSLKANGKSHVVQTARGSIVIRIRTPSKHKEKSASTTVAPMKCDGSSCKCGIGYSFDRSRGQCRILTECTKFSDIFERYEKKVLWGYNKDIYHFKTASSCMKKCLNARKYLCKAVNHDFRVRTCYTKAYSWYEAPSSATRTGILYHFYQRQCQW